MSHATTTYVKAMIEPLLSAQDVFWITEALRRAELRVMVRVTTSSAKARVVGRSGENIHAIQHLARERQRRDDPTLKVHIDVILADTPAERAEALGGGER